VADRDAAVIAGCEDLRPFRNRLLWDCFILKPLALGLFYFATGFQATTAPVRSGVILIDRYPVINVTDFDLSYTNL
jgi:hypothetical protein